MLLQGHSWVPCIDAFTSPKAVTQETKWKGNRTRSWVNLPLRGRVFPGRSMRPTPWETPSLTLFTKGYCSYFHGLLLTLSSAVSCPFNQGRPCLLTGAVHNGPRTPAGPDLTHTWQMVWVCCFLFHSEEERFQFLFFVFIRQNHPKWNLQAGISIYNLQNWSWNRA